MSALHVFDMDGTLLRASTSIVEIGRQLGQLAQLEAIEARFAAGEFDSPMVAAELHALWSGLTDEVVAEVAAAAPWIGGIEEVCADIAARGETSMLITLSPEFFARHLHARGLEIIHASVFPALPFAEPVDPSGLLSPADKVRLTDAERRARGLSASACVAYGDSLSDQPLFAHLPNSVAVNADPALEALAERAYRGENLWGAYVHGRHLLERSAGPGAGS